MRNITVMIKPASGLCDLRCRYCFYHDITEKRNVKNCGMMDTETAEVIIKRVMEEQVLSCCFAFQGGEPLLRGLDFYRWFTETVRSCNKKNRKVSYAVQTNGIHLNEEWAEFFRRNHFLVGISLDGPAEIHNQMRIDGDGKGTYGKVRSACSLLTRYGVPYNILCVVTSASARYGMKIYEYCKKQEFSHIQFIPCMEPSGKERGAYALSDQAFESFLKTIFDLWFQDFQKGKYISIRHIDNYLAILAGEVPELCTMKERCSCQFAVEADGSVYPCDFYMTDEWCLGNIKDHSWEEMRSGETAEKFIAGSALGETCLGCEWRLVCKGGCRRDREEGKNIFCQSYKGFFEYAIRRLETAAMAFNGR